LPRARFADRGLIAPRIGVVDWDGFSDVRLPTAFALPLQQGTSARDDPE
jgi:hypothetical protein